MGCTSSNLTIEYSEQMTHSCHCGNVTLRNVESNPRVLLECCCRSCVQRVEWAISYGSPVNRVLSLGDHGPSFNIICADSFTEINGQYLLTFYKTSENAKSVMLIADCCKTMIAV